MLIKINETEKVIYAYLADKTIYCLNDMVYIDKDNLIYIPITINGVNYIDTSSPAGEISKEF